MNPIDKAAKLKQSNQTLDELISAGIQLQLQITALETEDDDPAPQGASTNPEPEPGADPSPGEGEAEDKEPKKSILNHIKGKPMSAAIHKSAKNQRFNLNKFILALADKSYSGGGYEIEMSQEAALKSGKDSSTPMIPFGAFVQKSQDAITASPNTGLALAQPANHDDLFTITSAADFMASAAGQLGVPVYQAPLGPFKVPRMTVPLVPAWVPRDTGVPNTTGQFDALTISPKTLGGVCEIERSALIDCAPPMQSVISDAIWAAVLSALDDALLGQATVDADAPLGIYSQLVGGANDFGALDPAALLYALATIADKNKDPLQFIASNVWGAYAASTGLSATLDQRSLLDGMPANYVRVQSGRMNAFDTKGTPAPVAPAVNLHSFFGPFSSHCASVMFGAGVELMVNPYADSVYSKGAILVRCMVDADILIRDKTRFGMAYNLSA